jgi:hypothetical protein|tara:strand:+ start:7758 stop:8396 length:639 start_codon:yes stop_codon:yes gene_type:complete
MTIDRPETQKQIKTISNKLSDFDDMTAFLLLKEYLISTNLYSKSQRLPAGRKFFDLKYIFIFNQTEMYLHKNNEGTFDKHSRIYKDEYICVSNIIGDTSMNPDFIKYIDMDNIEVRMSKNPESKSIIKNHGYKEVHIQRKVIQKVIDKELMEELEAILKYYIFAGIKLKTLNRNLGKYQKKFDSMSYKAKRKKLHKAIETLRDLLIYQEVNS